MSLKLPPEAVPLDLRILDRFEVLEVLYAAELPVVFVAASAAARTLLAYAAGVEGDHEWILLAPCSAATVESLKEGRVAVREVLTGSCMWMARRGASGAFEGIWSVNEGDIPDAHLPVGQTLLYDDLEPVLSVRALGDEIKSGAVPASVVAFLPDAVRAALKTILDHVLERDTRGAPPADVRALYDLPVRRFAFNSFELAFGARTVLFENEHLQRAAKLLENGLEWAASGSADPLVADSDEERAAVLRAVLRLAPPSTGPISAVEVGGRWMHRPKKMNRKTRSRLRAEVQKLQTEHVVRKEGRIGELDRDKCTFILRDVVGAEPIKAAFAEDLLDDVLEYFNAETRVEVAGLERDGKFYVSAVAALRE